MALGKLPPPPGQPSFGHEEETEAVSANDAALQRGSHFPARHRPLGSLQGEAPGEARRAAGRSSPSPPAAGFWGGSGSGGWLRTGCWWHGRSEGRKLWAREFARRLAPGGPGVQARQPAVKLGRCGISGASGVSPGGYWPLGSRGFPDEVEFLPQLSGVCSAVPLRELLCAANTARNPPSSPTTSSLSFLPFLLKTLEKWLSVFFSFERY